MPEESDPAAAIRKGELKFVVEGERLHGGWVLVRIKNRRPGDKKNNWLLIKHRDNFARDNDGVPSWPRIARSRRAARWPKSQRARAAALLHSFSPPSTRRRPMRSGTRTRGAPRSYAPPGRPGRKPHQRRRVPKQYRANASVAVPPDARIRRTRAMQANRAAALGSRMGARGQV